MFENKTGRKGRRKMWLAADNSEVFGSFAHVKVPITQSEITPPVQHDTFHKVHQHMQQNVVQVLQQMH